MRAAFCRLLDDLFFESRSGAISQALQHIAATSVNATERHQFSFSSQKATAFLKADLSELDAS